MPGAVSRSSTFALTNATFPYLRQLARLGLSGFVGQDVHTGRGLNTWRGKVYHEGVSSAFDMELAPMEEVLNEEGEDE